MTSTTGVDSISGAASNVHEIVHGGPGSEGNFKMDAYVDVCNVSVNSKRYQPRGI